MSERKRRKGARQTYTDARVTINGAEFPGVVSVDLGAPGGDTAVARAARDTSGDVL